MGGEVIAPDGVTVEGYENGPGFVKAMQWYSDIHNKYNIAPKGISAAETIGQFTAGKICFVSANLFDYKNFEKIPDFEYGYSPMPYFKEGKPVTPTDSWHLSVSNFSKNKDVAAEFIKYMTLGEGNEIFLDVQGDFAAKLDTLKSYETDLKFADFPKKVFRLAAVEAMTTAVPRPLSLGYREWEAIITSTMEDIRNGAGVKSSLDKAVSSIDAQMLIYK
jgi:multiple sugar transport system substrate-binding protein